jgi:8-oxo-dGTP pyrophosphatase MutT (NUDIX family)
MTSYKEQVIPIIVNQVTLETYLGTAEKINQFYHNVMVPDVKNIKYIRNERKEGNYIRKNPIVRYYNEHVCWPEHPLNINGKIQGAIAIIHSKDDKILLVRNLKLWGLPKGARNYKEFNRLKTLTDDHFRETSEILRHESMTLNDDDAETSLENVEREVREETGIIIDRDGLNMLTYNQSGSYCAYDGYYYEYPKTSKEYHDDIMSNGTDHENDELLWVTPVELEQMIHNHQQHHRQGTHARVFNHVTCGYLEEYIREC